MGLSHNLAGAGLTVAFPLAVLGAVVLWGFFGRHPGRSFGGISKSASSEAAGRPEIQPSDARGEGYSGPVQDSLG